MWAAQYIKHNKAKKFITSGGLGTMGFGYGAAIGTNWDVRRTELSILPETVPST